MDAQTVRIWSTGSRPNNYSVPNGNWLRSDLHTTHPPGKTQVVARAKEIQPKHMLGLESPVRPHCSRTRPITYMKRHGTLKSSNTPRLTNVPVPKHGARLIISVEPCNDPNTSKPTDLRIIQEEPGGVREAILKRYNEPYQAGWIHGGWNE